MNFKNLPLVLIILDGWGLSDRIEGNAIAQAKKPNMDFYRHNCPYTILSSSGEDVGLPEGQMGNSEVGHLNIGAGRIVYQELTRITKAIREGDFFNNEELLAAVKHAVKFNSSLHLMGLLSNGGVHSHIDHLFALLELCRRHKLKSVYVHCFLVGRDVPPTSALNYISDLEDKLALLETGKIATVTGRYYAMDRDRRWERTKKAYEALVLGEGLREASARNAVLRSYARQEWDEFVRPTVITGQNGRPLAQVKDNDAVVFFNFRPDRARQLTRAFVDKVFYGFERSSSHPQVHFTCMTLYDKTISAPVAFKPYALKNTLGEMLSHSGIRQLRLAETEKYAHVTFFLNGGVEIPFPGEERLLIPSPKVATYDQKPEMSALEITNSFLEKLASDKNQVTIMNYANADMVGHTGNMQATVRAIETVDQCLKKVVEEVVNKGGVALITADHGNAEEMLDEQGGIHTAHTRNPVPFVIVGQNLKDLQLRRGRLEDIAPTALSLLGLFKPTEMTGKQLFVY